MQDEQAAAGERGVPAHLAAVLQQEVFVGVAAVVYHIAFSTLLEGLHVLHFLGGAQFLGLGPSGHHTLIAGVAAGLIAAAIVGAVVHEVPHKHAHTVAVGAGVVEVGIAQTVAELMAHGADTAYVALAVELGTAGIGVDGHAVELQLAGAVAVLLGRVEVVLMGPDGVGSTTVGLAHAGIDHIHLVYIAVIVPVVVGEVHL